MLHTDVPNEAMITEEALLLAKADRSPPTNTLTRDNLGRIKFSDMQVREGHLRAVTGYLDGNVGFFEDPMPGEDLEESRNRPGKIAVPEAKRWIKIWASTYKREPVRTFHFKGESLKSDDPIAELIARRYKEAEINTVFANVDFSMRAVGNVALRPWFDNHNNELVFHTYKSQTIRVVPNDNNPKRPWATVLTGTRIDRVKDKSASGVKVNVAEVWTQKEILHFDGEHGIERENFDTSRAPIVHCFEELPNIEEGYFCSCPGPLLVAISAILDRDYYSQLGFILLMQGLGVAQVFGLAEGTKLEIGPGRVISFPGDPDAREGLEYANPNAPLSEWVDVITFLVDKIREAFGIPQSMLSVETDSSGAAIVQANGPTIEMREERQIVFRRIENETLQATVDVLGKHDPEALKILGGKDPKDFTVTVDYGSITVSVATQDQINLDSHRLTIGTTTPAEILMRDRPDEFDTVEQAEQFLADRKARQDRLTIDAKADAKPDDEPDDENTNDPESNKDDPDDEE